MIHLMLLINRMSVLATRYSIITGNVTVKEGTTAGQVHKRPDARREATYVLAYLS